MTAPVIEVDVEHVDSLDDSPIRHVCCVRCNGLPFNSLIAEETSIVMLCGVRKPFRRSARRDPVCAVCLDLVTSGSDGGRRCPVCGAAR